MTFKKPFIFSIFLLLLGLLAYWFFSAPSPKKSPSPSESAVMHVGTNAEYPPFSFIKEGAIVGFDIDIAHEVARRLNKTILLEDMPFEMLLPKLQLGDIELIAAGMTLTPERAKRVLFTKPYFTRDPLLIISPKSHALKTVGDLQGKTVVVNDGYTADGYVSKMHDVCVQRLATPAEAILSLRSGRADAYVTARSALQPFFNLYGAEEFYTTEIPDVFDNYSLVISPRHAPLLPSIQEALDAMQTDGTLDTLKKRWNIQ